MWWRERGRRCERYDVNKLMLIKGHGMTSALRHTQSKVVIYRSTMTCTAAKCLVFPREYYDPLPTIRNGLVPPLSGWLHLLIFINIFSVEKHIYLLSICSVSTTAQKKKKLEQQVLILGWTWAWLGTSEFPSLSELNQVSLNTSILPPC